MKCHFPIWLFACYLTIGGCFVVDAQQTRFRFSHLKEGLSNVLSIHQDAYGFIWFGTKNGLNKYDGYSLTVYEASPKNPHTIKENWITSIVEDSQSNLYIGTFGGGLNIFDRKTETFSAIVKDSSNVNSLSGNVVLSLCYVSDEEIMVGTSEGFCIYNAVSGDVTRIDGVRLGLASRYMAAVTKSEDGLYWLGTEFGLYALNADWQVVAVLDSVGAGGNAFRDKHIRSLCFDSQGVLWAGTDAGGLHRVEKKQGKYHITQIPMSDGSDGTSGLAILALYEDSQGRLWIGTEGGGLNLYHRESQSFSHYEHDPQDIESISNYSIWSIAEDHVGNLWFGTFNQGITKIDPYFCKFSQLRKNHEGEENSLSNNIVNAFYEDEEGLFWVATDGGGLNIYDPKKKHFTHYEKSASANSLSSRAVLCIEPSTDGSVWLGTWVGGINIAQGSAPDKLSFKHLFPDEHFFSIVAAESGKMWAGSWGNGLFLIDKTGEKYLRLHGNGPVGQKLSNNHILHLLGDSKGRLWAGTLFGLNLIEQQADGSWKVQQFQKSFDDPNSLSSNTVLVCFEDSKGQVWIGTEGGLNRFDEDTRSFTQFYRADGLAGSGIRSILEDSKGNLWVATSQGLSKYNPNTQTFDNYDTSDGLLLNDFNARAAMKSNDGTLFFGSTEGITYFKPEDIVSNPHLPKVYITDFKLFNKTVPIGGEGSPLKTNILLTDKITLTDEQSVFSFEYVGLNYTHADKNQYAYRLVGLETDWNYVGDHRFASYSNLDAGKYVFEVKASNNDGKWSSQPATLAIEVLPAWYETWYVRASATSLAIAAALIFYLIRVNILQKQKRVLERVVEERTQEVLQKKEEIEIQAEALKEVNLSLEQKVAQRTVDLKEAYEELNQFTYHSAHDLKGPIARLLGLCYLGKFEIEDEKATAYFTKLSNTANHLNELLSELMRAQEIKTKEVETVKIKLKEVIETVFKQMLDTKPVDRLNLQLLFDSDMIIVSDPLLISILFEALIKNGIDFREENIPTEIAITCTRKDNSLNITVQNNGVGIAPEVADRIFEMFVIGNEKSKGMGLGLYEAKIITKKLHGSIELASPKRGNTVFKLVLPVSI